MNEIVRPALFRPPAPTPLHAPLDLFPMLRALRKNPLTTWTQEHFRTPIVSGESALGRVTVVSDPAAIRHIFVDNAANYRKDELQRRVLAPGLGNGLLTAEGDEWRLQRRTLAPLFAAAFATQNNWETFLVGMAASVGAGISMGLTEALSDDGQITGRGSPWLRGLVCGVMTAVGGIGHTLPYLVPDSWPNAFLIATIIAAIVVAVELVAISWIRTKYMDTPFLRAAFQVVVGGVLVLLAGIFIGSA